MPQRLQDWYRYLEQQMHVSLPEGPAELPSGYRRGGEDLQTVPRNATPRSGAFVGRPEAPPRHAPVRAGVASGARAPDTLPVGPRSPDPRRRGGRRPITETREEIIRRLLDPELTLHEAAAVLNLSKATVRRYTDQGKLVCLRTHGGQRRFHLSTLLAFLDRQTPGADRER